MCLYLYDVIFFSGLTDLLLSFSFLFFIHATYTISSQDKQKARLNILSTIKKEKKGTHACVTVGSEEIKSEKNNIVYSSCSAQPQKLLPLYFTILIYIYK
jgi:hypothetical protein